MTRWTTGERTVNYLIERGKLEELGDADLESAAATALEKGQQAPEDCGGRTRRGRRRWRVLRRLRRVPHGGGIVARPTGTARNRCEGSHVTVEDTVSAQFADLVPAFGKATFERMRRTRHAAKYFDPSSPPIDRADAEWALDTSRLAVAGTTEVITSTPLDRFVE